ncbi:MULTISPECIES: hypothetical protein [Legionella]|uniref:Uncharacterized protein n=1 Tax=Legionella maceachernii TaxID=466 RepID=A0A0W0WDZ3_9GAMM|nr:hypothetical protein [Legionella maceachernii]KTD30581.1 hypothetical protein Lmac_0525 [Legionella maceachernii]SJZ97505.1 hypothetical protein SAMN02745128_01614 [Legionella maceachernii]SUP01076.1 Uncharacterised protein [Legionella maceachernii]
MLITREPSDKKIQFRLRMNESVFNEITDYCQWAGIRVRDYFIEQACRHIFINDTEWINHKQQRQNQSEKE